MVLSRGHSVLRDAIAELFAKAGISASQRATAAQFSRAASRLSGVFVARKHGRGGFYNNNADEGLCLVEFRDDPHGPGGKTKTAEKPARRRGSRLDVSASRR